MAKLEPGTYCWNCRRLFSIALPRNRQYPDYCNPCGHFKALGDNPKLAAMRWQASS